MSIVGAGLILLGFVLSAHITTGFFYALNLAGALLLVVHYSRINFDVAGLVRATWGLWSVTMKEMEHE